LILTKTVIDSSYLVVSKIIFDFIEKNTGLTVPYKKIKNIVYLIKTSNKKTILKNNVNNDETKKLINSEKNFENKKIIIQLSNDWDVEKNGLQLTLLRKFDCINYDNINNTDNNNSKTINNNKNDNNHKNNINNNTTLFNNGIHKISYSQNFVINNNNKFLNVTINCEFPHYHHHHNFFDRNNINDENKIIREGEVDNDDLFIDFKKNIEFEILETNNENDEKNKKKFDENTANKNILIVDFFNIFSNLNLNFEKNDNLKKNINIYFEIRKAKKTDLFQPCYKKNEIKLKDFYREKKIPIHERDDVFVVVLKHKFFYKDIVHNNNATVNNNQTTINNNNFNDVIIIDNNGNSDENKIENKIKENNLKKKKFVNETIAAVILNEKNIFIAKNLSEDHSQITNLFFKKTLIRLKIKLV
jgi:hypothetical protein